MTLKLRIDFTTSVHHGSGLALGGLVDRAFLRDENGIPYLAGSAIKGKFRHAAESVLRSTGQPGCHTPDDPAICKFELADDPGWCVLCQVFGSPFRRGSAFFWDAYPPEDPEREIVAKLIASTPSTVIPGAANVRSTTAIDRHRRTTRAQHLFSTEVVSPLIRFESTIEGRLSAEHADLLMDCATVLSHFGGDSSRGLGSCRLTLTQQREKEG